MNPFTRKRVRAALEELAKRGVIIDSGKKLNPKTGKWETAWILNPHSDAFNELGELLNELRTMTQRPS